jgi:hypothetical protein
VIPVYRGLRSAGLGSAHGYSHSSASGTALSTKLPALSSERDMGPDQLMHKVLMPFLRNFDIWNYEDAPLTKPVGDVDIFSHQRCPFPFLNNFRLMALAIFS